MQFRILGPLTVRTSDGELIALSAAKHRMLLSIMLLHANQLVRGDRLIDALWPDQPPRSARQVLRTYVSALRCSLALSGQAGAPALMAGPGGYQLQVAPAELDVLAFHDLAQQADRALTNGDLPLAAERLHGALALWRGRVAEDVALDGQELVTIASLEEMRLAVHEKWLEARLALGHHSGLIADLRTLVTDNPLREHLAVLLMSALYGAGRQAEALAAYADTRRLLVEELGVEPGPELRRVHHDILAHHDVLAPNGADRHRQGPAPVSVPRQLPAPVQHLAARTPELQTLTASAQQAAGPDAAMEILVIAGAAGVGKTTLAVYWGHQVAGRFPDGQLYVNLRGFSPDGPAMSPEEAVRGFLDAFGVAAERMPASVIAQSGLYRSLLAGRRVLVVLDNARDTDQVRPLLPSSPGCLAVVTSRTQLHSLVATEGARLLTVDVLTAAEARQLLASRLGLGRVAAEPNAVAEIITWCAGLPLALAVVAARASAHPRFSLAAIADELHDVRGLPGALDATDPATDVRAVFSWSYQQLSPEAAQLFRLIGLHPGPDLSRSATASLAGFPAQSVRPLLAELGRAHLLTEHLPGRYASHDLLRAYAAELAYAVDSDEQRRAAHHRMLDHYLHTASAADLLLFPYRNQVALDRPQHGVTIEDLSSGEQAHAWLIAEHPGLVAAVLQAASDGFDTHAWQLAWAHADFLFGRGQWHDLAVTNAAALDAARRTGDQAGQAHAHRGLAGADTSLGHHDDAYNHLQQALGLFRGLGSRTDQALIHRNLALVLEGQGRYADALRHARRARDLYRADGDHTGQARALSTIGWFHALLGDYERALTDCQRAMTLHRELGDGHGEACAWDYLGYVHHQLGDYEQAITCYERALPLLRQVGDRSYEAIALSHLGDTHHAVGDAHAARRAWQQALDMLDQPGDPSAGKLRAKLHRIGQRDAPATPHGRNPGSIQPGLDTGCT